ncbi:lipid-A-disaccharide kinase [Singulisphaera sp. GP187]|uniref:tetraacyldisaccharide 4'-kinase n=1 Tax=Singulisphaera sp. GP187 TaxID=1882752 RepID=UPI00092C4267|nr:tetraacyldisaccharide 4'-kinase [Singulisphaera sp. GP187]SIO59381.1 lipid-A-disaccharide kinase [Singulisphaera sp. GP187]
MSHSTGWFSEAGFLRLVRGESRSPGARLARVGLRMAAAGYGLAVAVRNARYDRGGSAVQGVAIPVIAVGNLTLGGTGKTPMVEWVARWYRARGIRVAILSRGYGQDDGVNDEGRVLEENLPDVPHLQGADRVRLAEVAVEEIESEVLVLDDGFQHRRLKRDLDIVLLDALEPFGLGWIFPRGLLREPVRSLRRAGVVVLSRADLVPESTRKAIRAEAERRAGPLRWVEARHAPLDLLDAEGPATSIESLAGRSVAAFCGIGNPDGFRKTIEPLTGPLVGFRAWPDHHSYTAADVADLTTWVRGLKADLVLTTQKDLVKLRASNLGAVPLRALRIGLEIMSGQTVLDEALEPFVRPT